MRASARAFIVFLWLLLSSSLTLAQELPPVTQAPAGITFDDWKESGRPEGSIEYSFDFPSPLASPYEANNTVPLRVLVPEEASSPLPVVLILHYWGATDLRAELSFAGELNRRGIAAAIMTLPYHLGRTPPGKRSGELAIEPDPERLRFVMTQATLDARRAIDFLVSRPEFRADRIGLMGTSLGAVVAALVYAVEPRVKDVAFVVGGVDLAGILWNSSRVVPQRDLLRRRGFTETRLRETLSGIEPENILPRKDETRSFVIAGMYDTVIPRFATERLIAKLNDPQVLWLETGHYGGIFVQRRLLREVARFFESVFKDEPFTAPKRLVAPTLRIGVKFEAGLGADLGVGLDLLRLDRRGDLFLTAFVTPRNPQLVLARRISMGLSLSASASTRGFGVGLFWSSVL